MKSERVKSGDSGRWRQWDPCEGSGKWRKWEVRGMGSGGNGSWRNCEVKKVGGVEIGK